MTPMRNYDGSAVLEAIRLILATHSDSAALTALGGFIEAYGFEKIFLGHLVNPYSVPLKDILYLSNWPEELKAAREKQAAILHDPVAICAIRSKRPFTWAEARAHATRSGRRIVDLVHGFGLTHGMMFPMHALDSVSGGVSLGGPLKTDLSPIQIRELEIVCQAAYYHLERMHGPFPYQKVAELTGREAECVTFAASGKSNWEIAHILGIQEDTVKKTLRRASNKLGAVNRTHLVASAIARHQIFP
ncbi:MAG: LuxR family transcriptional regulator [Alphaproteobacteria bacterium]|uniref:helix-turn-helix transcriptional regulator n=1 Tax=Hyphomonas sp. TaxID=87 RepID=UPI001D26DADA|nr:LuxR family transcriptional regulator [Alphaproteobacteria bacterium]